MSGVIQYLSFGDWFISLSITSSRFIHVVAYCRTSFSRLNNKYFIVCVCVSHMLHIHPSVGGHMGCFQILIVANNAAMNTGIQIPL